MKTNSTSRLNVQDMIPGRYTGRVATAIRTAQSEQGLWAGCPNPSLSVQEALINSFTVIPVHAGQKRMTR